VKALLINVTPEGKSKEVPLSHERTVLGRLDDCQIRIPSGRVSRHHCEITRDNGALTLRDLNSSNGTFVNQKKVDEATLSAGDLISIGSLVFLVQIDGEPKEFEPEFLYEDGIPEQQGSGDAQSSGTATASSEPATVNAPTSSGDDSSMMDFNFEFDLDEDEDDQPPL